MLKTALKIILLFAFISLCASGAYYYMNSKVEIATVAPKRGHAIQGVYATGTVEPTVMLPLAPRIAGRITAVNAEEGDSITAGQVLAQLEDEDLQKTLAELQARAVLAQTEYDRAAQLDKNGVTAKKVLDTATAELAAANAAVERALVNLSYMRLIAPADGIVIRADGDVGELIPVNQPIFWISCCAGLRIEAEVDEEDVSMVKPGQDVAIRADAFPDDLFNGEVLSITPKGDPVSRSYRARISLPAEVKLMIGMTVETNIVIREDENALLLPAEAVRDGAVYALRGDAVLRQPVKMGAQTPQYVEVLSGLEDNAEVIRDADAFDPAEKRYRFLREDWQLP